MLDVKRAVPLGNPELVWLIGRVVSLCLALWNVHLLLLFLKCTRIAGRKLMA